MAAGLWGYNYHLESWVMRMLAMLIMALRYATEEDAKRSIKKIEQIGQLILELRIGNMPNHANIKAEDQRARSIVQWLRLKGYPHFRVPDETYTKSWSQKPKNKKLGVSSQRSGSICGSALSSTSNLPLQDRDDEVRNKSLISYRNETKRSVREPKEVDQNTLNEVWHSDCCM